jgi:hypothetical protein
LDVAMQVTRDAELKEALATPKEDPFRRGGMGRTP